jgi:hypothetical protein
MKKETDESGDKKAPPYLAIADKNDVLKFELNNFDKVVFFASGGFWCATQHSCLFVLNLLGVKAKMHVTYDKYIQKDRIYAAFHSGHFSSIHGLIQEYGCKTMRKDNKILVFQLPETVTPEQIKAWEHDDETRARKIDAYFLPDSGETRLYRLLRDLGREVFLSGNQMRQNARELIAGRMVDLCLEMFRAYMKLEKQSSPEVKTAINSQILSLVNDFSFIATVAHDEGLIEDKRMMRVGALLKDLGKTLKTAKDDGHTKPRG